MRTRLTRKSYERHQFSWFWCWSCLSGHWSWFWYLAALDIASDFCCLCVLSPVLRPRCPCSIVASYVPVWLCSLYRNVDPLTGRSFLCCIHSFNSHVFHRERFKKNYAMLRPQREWWLWIEGRISEVSCLSPPSKNKEKVQCIPIFFLGDGRTL